MTHTQSSKLKIGIVLSAMPGYSETFFRNKIKGLQKNGIEVILFVDIPSQTASDLSCKVVCAPDFNSIYFSKLSKSLMAAFKCIVLHPKRSLKHYNLDKKDGTNFKQRIKNLLLNQYLLQEKLDWLHFGYGMLASNRENVAESIGSKMAVSFRGFDLYLSPLKHKDCYKILFTKAVQYHVLSKKMKQKLSSYNISEANIKVITPAIDIDLFETTKDKTNNNQSLNIVCVSRLHWVKGLNYLLEAVSILRQESIAFKLTIIGDGEEEERLIFAAYQLGILPNITFTGKLPQGEVIKHLKKANLYVQYSIQEGFGNAALEAQAMGLLCVVSDADGLQENVLHEKTGLVVPKRNPKALAKAIIEIHNLSAVKKQRMADFAVNRIQNDFKLEKQNVLFLEFYHN
jgi:colanic acid/amylovoran biosynthesis glycosyltransferase